jgi:pilus assembly protein CpaB
MGRRTLLLITSILIAAVGTALVAIYVRGADERAESNADLVEVLVATKQVPAGSSVQQAVESNSFDQGRVLKREIVDAYTSVSQLRELAQSGAVAAGPILPGQVIQRGMFSDTPAAVASGGLTGNQMRLAVQLNDPNRSAGFLQSGSDVAVFVTTGEGEAQRTNLLLDSVRVLSVGATVQPSGGQGGGEAAAGDATSAVEDSVPTTIVSVAVDQAQAQQLIFAQKAGELYFAILQPGKKGTPGQKATVLGDIQR